MVRSRSVPRRIFRKYDALNERAEENLAGIRVVKSYVREDYEKQKYERAATAGARTTSPTPSASSPSTRRS